VAENAIIHDLTPIHLLDGDDKSVIWFGTLLEFELANGFDDAECAHLRTDLLQRGRFVVGGGATQPFIVELQ
jgi:hypothetical protein